MINYFINISLLPRPPGLEWRNGILWNSSSQPISIYFCPLIPEISKAILSKGLSTLYCTRGFFCSPLLIEHVVILRHHYSLTSSGLQKRSFIFFRISATPRRMPDGASSNCRSIFRHLALRDDNLLSECSSIVVSEEHERSTASSRPSMLTIPVPFSAKWSYLFFAMRTVCFKEHPHCNDQCSI